MIEIISTILIITIFTLTLLFTLTKLYIYNRQMQQKLAREQELIDSILEWSQNYVPIKTNYTLEDLFIPAKSGQYNLNINVNNIDVIDYTKNVPWFQRV